MRRVINDGMDVAGGSGICKGITKALMAHGAKAVITSRKQERLDAAAKELAEAHMERESAAARGREDAQASEEDVRKLAGRIVDRVTRRHQQQSLRSVFDALRP